MLGGRRWQPEEESSVSRSAFREYPLRRFLGDLSGGVIAWLIALSYGLTLAPWMGLPHLLHLPAPAACQAATHASWAVRYDFHLYAHCLDDGRASAAPVTITHRWRQPDGPKSHTVTLAQPGVYEVAVDAEPVCESIEIAVPSDTATEKKGRD